MLRQIIIIHSHEPTRTLIVQLLCNAGYSAVGVDSGQLAYDTIRQLRPDLAVLDLPVEAPDTALLALDMLRLDPQTAALPIIVLTANVRLIEQLRPRLEEQGCVVLFKPVGGSELLAAVARSLA